MENRVKKFIKDNNININNKVVVAVSGGSDSIALIHILINLGYDCILAHVNHHKRIESENEAIEMENLAKKLNIPFELFNYYDDNTDNFHNASHNARYNFFRDVCNKYKTNIIATAHNQDDLIETVLIKIMEGSNLYGYGGISIINDDGKYKIIRPLLCLSKDEIYEYNKMNNNIYFEDSSNHKDYYLRNRLRHNIIPLLKKESDDLYNKVLEYSIQVKEAFNYIRQISINYLNSNDNKIDLNSFKSFDIALKKDIISLLLERYYINKNNDLLNQLLSLLDNNKGTKSINLSNNYKFIRSYDLAYITNLENNESECLEIKLDEEVIFNSKYKFYFSKNIPLNNVKYLKLCYNKLEFPIYVRNRKNGDIIKTPLGTKTISRLLIDKKVSKEIRDNIPLIVDNNGNILWVYDYQKSINIFDMKENSNIYLVCEELL